MNIRTRKLGWLHMRTSWFDGRADAQLLDFFKDKIVLSTIYEHDCMKYLVHCESLPEVPASMHPPEYTVTANELLTEQENGDIVCEITRFDITGDYSAKSLAIRQDVERRIKQIRFGVAKLFKDAGRKH